MELADTDIYIVWINYMVRIKREGKIHVHIALGHMSKNVLEKLHAVGIASKRMTPEQKNHNPPHLEPPSVYTVLKDAVKAVPAVAYAQGVLGVVCVVVIIGLFKLNLFFAALEVLILLGLMFGLLLFAIAVKQPDNVFKGAALVMIWTFVLTFIGMLGLAVSCVFWKQPLDYQALMGQFSSDVTTLETKVQRLEQDNKLLLAQQAERQDHFEQELKDEIRSNDKTIDDKTKEQNDELHKILDVLSNDSRGMLSFDDKGNEISVQRKVDVKPDAIRLIKRYLNKNGDTSTAIDSSR